MNVRRRIFSRATGWTGSAVLAVSSATRTLLVFWGTILPLLAVTSAGHSEGNWTRASQV